MAQAGAGTVGENLNRYARILLDADTPALILADQIGDAALDAAVNHHAEKSGLAASLETTVADYLRAEQHMGRVAADVDTHSYGFLITGAIHNLIAAGDAYPRPDSRELEHVLAAVARQIEPR